ncbi:MAG: 2-C-methyl-D-erythritol 2,4-cyclodiphosphate synthase [Gammaproteobacteria bacterium]
MIRVGCGFDAHAFAAGRRLVLGGVEIPFGMGLAGHSDADLLSHAVCDALFGAFALGDIGAHFPDNDETYRDAKSILLLAQTAQKIAAAGGRILNIDASIALQRPKLSPHIPAMRNNLAEALGVSLAQVSVKATTTDKLGFVGREEGAAVFAVALGEMK